MARFKSRTLTKDEVLLRASKGREIINVYLRSKPSGATQEQIIADNPKLASEYKFNTKDMYNILARMTQAGMLSKSKVEGSRHVTYTFASSVEKEKRKYKVKDTSTPTHITVKKYKLEQPINPSIQVDIVKATGRVRITTQGITIEIGVV